MNKVISRWRPAAHDGRSEHVNRTANGEAIWYAMRVSATDVALREPMLRPRLRALVLARASLSDALAAVLADRLASAHLRRASLHALLRTVLDQDPTMPRQLVADLEAMRARDPACPDYLHGMLNMKGFQALQTYRVAHSLWRQGRCELATTLSNKASVVFCVDIHPAARIGGGVMLDHGTGIVIGETAEVEDDVSILQNVTLGGTGKERGNRHPKIRSGVMIGAGAKILGNIEVGAMSKIAAGSVVLEPVPPHCTVAGVPARIVRRHGQDSLPALDMDQWIGCDQ